jgi:hypothetical protein
MVLAGRDRWRPAVCEAPAVLQTIRPADSRNRKRIVPGDIQRQLLGR